LSSNEYRTIDPVKTPFELRISCLRWKGVVGSNPQVNSPLMSKSVSLTRNTSRKCKCRGGTLDLFIRSSSLFVSFLTVLNLLFQTVACGAETGDWGGEDSRDSRPKMSSDTLLLLLSTHPSICGIGLNISLSCIDTDSDAGKVGNSSSYWNNDWSSESQMEIT
jgi:hypothetical protein